MEFILWHGTNQNFDTFDETMLGLHTYNPASKAAFFFAAHPDTAREYARSASNKLLPNQVEHDRKIDHLLYKAEQASNGGDFDGYERYILEAEELESAARQAPAWDGVILKCRITVEALTEVSGSDRYVLNNFGDILTNAKNEGFDALILRDIIDTPSGEGPVDSHLAVYNVSCIEILEKYDAKDPLPYDPEAIPRDHSGLQDPFHIPVEIVQQPEFVL